MNNSFNYSFLIDNNFHNRNQQYSHIPLEIISEKYIYMKNSDTQNTPYKNNSSIENKK